MENTVVKYYAKRKSYIRKEIVLYAIIAFSAAALIIISYFVFFHQSPEDLYKQLYQNTVDLVFWSRATENTKSATGRMQQAELQRELTDFTLKETLILIILNMHLMTMQMICRKSVFPNIRTFISTLPEQMTLMSYSFPKMNQKSTKRLQKLTAACRH